MKLFTLEQLQSLNELETLVYRYIIEHPNTVPYMRIRELAAQARVSTTTVLHFCKKMGCDGYAQFKWQLKEQIGSAGRTDAIPDTMGELRVFLERVNTPEYQDRIDEAASCIATSERVFVVGIGNSGRIAEYGARYFSNMGKFTLSLSDPFYPITVSPNMTMTAVLLSVSGETLQMLDLARKFKEKGGILLTLTCSEESTLAKMSDLTLPYDTVQRRYGAEGYDFSSQLPTVYLLETLSRRVYNRSLE